MNKRLVHMAIMLLMSVYCREVAAQVHKSSLPHDSVLCKKYGSFLRMENRVFHSELFDSTAAVDLVLKNSSEVTMQELLKDKIMSHPSVYISLGKNRENFIKIVNDSASQSFKSLNNGELFSIYLSNLIVKASVIEKKELQREYVNFKSTFLLRIDRIYKSDWDEIKVGDTIVLKSMAGVEYDNDSTTLIQTGGYQTYSVGETQIFSLSNANYHKILYGLMRHTPWAQHNYKDFPCSGFFRATPGDNRFYNDMDKEEDLIEYIKNYINE